MEQGPQLFAGRYELISELGRGGFSIVHLARNVRTGVVVALKVLRRGANGEYEGDVAARFEREVASVANLRHPNTVRMLDYGRTDDGTLFMVSEYLPGQDLFELLRNGRTLPPDVVFHILTQLLGSLSEAHAQGLLHRDIKPQNIRVFEHEGDPYTVKLIDFGIARPMAPTSAQMITRDGALVGTPRYMSPEQLTDRALAPSSDLYSLGLVAYEMLFGEDALRGSSLSEQFDRLLVDNVVAQRTVTIKIGPQLERVLERMTARNPADRFQSAEATIAALRNPGYAAPRVRRITPSVSQAQTRGWTTAQIAGGAAALTLVCAFLTLVIVNKEEPKVVPPPPRQNLSALLTPKEDQQQTQKVEDPEPEPAVDMGSSSEDLGSGECFKPAPFVGTGSLSAGLGEPRWLTYIPKSYNPRQPAPLVFLFHPDGQTGKRILDQTKFAALAEEEGIIVIAPDYWNRGEGNFLGASWAWRDKADVGVLEQILRTAEDAVCVDASRVFAVGHGAGGTITRRLACAPWISGVATNGHRPSNEEPLCAADMSKPAIILNQMNSKRMPPDGPATCFVATQPIPLVGYEKMWRKRNGCSGKRTNWEPRPHGTCEQYQGCRSPFVSCHVDGGYGWPGSPEFRELDLSGTCGDVAGDFPATEMIWRFFADLSRIPGAD